MTYLSLMEFTGLKIIDAQLILEAMTESVLVTSTDLEAPGPEIMYVNSAFEKMTGWNRDEIIGKSPRLLQGPNTDFSIFQDLKEKIKSGQVWSGRTINYRKDKSEFHMEWSITGLRNEKGEISHFLAVQREVTQVVLTEQRLKLATEAEKERIREIEKTNDHLNRILEEQTKTLSLFTKYVPEPIVKMALAEKSENQQVGETLDAGLLFCDIRNFTHLIDGLSPDEVVDLLNIYYSFMSQIITDHQGVIIQFVGDEIFVAFGAPLKIENSRLQATRCAIKMIEQLKNINLKLQEKYNKDMVVGIGVNYGSVIAGNLGSEDKLSYSITGKEVLIAKSIESLTRGKVNVVLISESVYSEVKDKIPAKAWGKVALKGKTEKMNVYQVIHV
jgi:PAS domain S-box-containing protein